MLPSPKIRFCTRKAKIKPFQDWLNSGEDEPVTIYYGIRADEDRTGYVPVDGQYVEYPLQDLGIDRNGVYTILDAQGLRPPSFWWEGMWHRVRSMIGGGWQDLFEQWQLETLFSWRTRSNCSFCFFQRQYEIIGLLEHHPDLFWDAVYMERDIGGSGYTWRRHPMTRALDPEYREDVKTRRAKKIIKHIQTAQQRDLFNESGDTAISQTSCGMLCGK
jgi:hypothetical protein